MATSYNKIYILKWLIMIRFEISKTKWLALLIVGFIPNNNIFAQKESKQMVRLARLVIDSTQLASYNAMLKEEIETSIRVEPGVLTLYAMAEKDNPANITILEIYANIEAYHKHIQTPHFLKYKNGTKDMVKSLTLVEAIPLIAEMKMK